MEYKENFSKFNKITDAESALSGYLNGYRGNRRLDFPNFSFSVIDPLITAGIWLSTHKEHPVEHYRFLNLWASVVAFVKDTVRFRSPGFNSDWKSATLEDLYNTANYKHPIGKAWLKRLAEDFGWLHTSEDKASDPPAFVPISKSDLSSRDYLELLSVKAQSIFSSIKSNSFSSVVEIQVQFLKLVEEASELISQVSAGEEDSEGYEVVINNCWKAFRYVFELLERKEMSNACKHYINGKTERYVRGFYDDQLDRCINWIIAVGFKGLVYPQFPNVEKKLQEESYPKWILSKLRKEIKVGDQLYDSEGNPITILAINGKGPEAEYWVEHTPYSTGKTTSAILTLDDLDLDI